MPSHKALSGFAIFFSTTLFLGAHAAFADVVNVDFNQTGAEAIHSGSDGALSSGGSTWNGVIYNVAASDVDDENGVATSVDVTPTGFFGSSADGASSNDLQDSGLAGDGFDIGGLVSGNSYTLVIYGGGNMGHGITSSTGSTGGFCTGTPTYTLPGTSGLDYCSYAVQPFDLGGGDFGLRIDSLDGLITGFQISGTFDSPPAVPLLGPMTLGFLVMSLGVVGRAASARRGVERS